MSTKEAHFKPAVIVPATREPVDLPVDLMAGIGGVIVLFVITVLVVVKRMNRADQLPGE